MAAGQLYGRVRFAASRTTRDVAPVWSATLIPPSMLWYPYLPVRY